MLHIPKFWANHKHVSSLSVSTDRLWHMEEWLSHKFLRISLRWGLKLAMSFQLHLLLIFLRFFWRISCQCMAVLETDNYYPHSFINYWLWYTSVSREQWWRSGRALASHQRGPGLISRLGAICRLSLLVLFSGLRRFQFPRVLPFSPLLKNLHLIKLWFD